MDKWSDEELAALRIAQRAITAEEYVAVNLRRRDWRLHQRALTHYGHHLARRAERASSHIGGADQNELNQVRELADVIARAAGNDEGFA